MPHEDQLGFVEWPGRLEKVGENLVGWLWFYSSKHLVRRWPQNFVGNSQGRVAVQEQGFQNR